MAAEETYLVRGPDGRMSSVRAFSVDGAKKKYLKSKRFKRGDQFSIKPRERGAWEHFDVL